MKEQNIEQRELMRPYLGNVARRRIGLAVGTLAPLIFLYNVISNRPVAPERTEQVKVYELASELSEELGSSKRYQGIDRAIDDFLEGERTNLEILDYSEKKKNFDFERPKYVGGLVLGSLFMLAGPIGGFILGSQFGNLPEDNKRRNVKGGNEKNE
ncbi:hypothetical protein AUJ84_04360 [Candidatus Pacearchaeota archaeon CG1_02_32_132]|nr:MAG: hypothetical protein AUJ84_04360 [Candidatus Pacearchaeota archaeon CG1_02_32_132]